MHCSDASWEQFLNLIGLFAIVFSFPRARARKLDSIPGTVALIGLRLKILSSTSGWLQVWEQPTYLQI